MLGVIEPVYAGHEPAWPIVEQAPAARPQPRRVVVTTERVRAAVRDPAERDQQPEPAGGHRRAAGGDPRLLGSCDLSWQDCCTVYQIDQLKRRLRREYVPPLNRKQGSVPVDPMA